jgi:esterase/lipase superfamily enzyme
MFRALLAHPQEMFTGGTWYIACVLCQLAARNQLTQHARNIPNAVSAAPLEDEQVELKRCRDS